VFCRKHIVAGTTAGLVNVLALHPLDVIKTRLQVQDGAGTLPLYKGTLLSNLRIIVREEGWRALYAGKLKRKKQLHRSRAKVHAFLAFQGLDVLFGRG
jgi:hypothetical protein